MAAPRPPPPSGWHYERSHGCTRLVRDSGLGKTPLGVPVVETEALSPGTAMAVSTFVGPDGQLHVSAVVIKNLDPHTGCETCAEADRLLQRFGTECSLG